MILTDYDIIAKESQLEVLDYVIESAKFEIANGNDSYMAVYEAATDQADKSNDNWFAKIANKIKMFVKSAIAKLKMILNQLATKFRTRKAVKIQKKLTSGKFDTKAASTKDTSFDIANAISTMNSMENALADKTTSACMKFSDAIRNGSIPKSKDDFKTSYLGITKNVGNIPNEVQFTDAKKFIDNAVKYLTNLSKSTADIKKCNDTLKQSGKSASEIRYGISTMFNFLTAYVKEYYENAMKVSKYFMSNGVDSQNSAAATDDTAAGASSEETAETVKSAKEFAVDVEKEFVNVMKKYDVNLNNNEMAEITADFQKQMDAAAKKTANTSSTTSTSSDRTNIASNRKALPQDSEDQYRNIPNEEYKVLQKYAERMHKIIKRQIENAETEEAFNEAKQLYDEANKVWAELVHKKFDGKLAQKQLNRLAGEFKYMDLRTSSRFAARDRIANDPKKAINIDKIDDNTDIMTFINYAKTLPRSSREAVKERALTKCNKIIRSFRKKYGSDLENMSRYERNKLEIAFELRKQVKSL